MGAQEIAPISLYFMKGHSVTQLSGSEDLSRTHQPSLPLLLKPHVTQPSQPIAICRQVGSNINKQR
jgi:hypothetical protein